MKIGIVGGALQGMEAVFLAKKAGYEAFVIDRKETAPALSLADSFEIVDVVKETEKAKKLLLDCDAVIPANEEMDALVVLDKIMKGSEKPFLFDLNSYNISCSKEQSNKIMAGLDVPMPEPWPQCGFPAIVKPSSQSGSIGVNAVANENEMAKALDVVKDLNDTPIIQEFVSGKSVSIEVIGNGSSATSYITTEVVLDANYDCKMVVCEPNILPEEDDKIFADIGKRVAEGIKLKGLMDVEAIYTAKGLRVLEIDARIPSQTPAAVWAATGINLLEEFVCSALGKSTGKKSRNEYASYEHYFIDFRRITTCGEKVFGKVHKPRLEERFFGADEAITDYYPGREWCATIINSGSSSAEVLNKRKKFIRNVMEACEAYEYSDSSPKMI